MNAISRYPLFPLALLVLGGTLMLGMSGQSALAQESEESWEGPWITLHRVFENLRFDRPVFLTGAGDQSGRLFVVEQAGVVRVIPATEPVPATESDRSQLVEAPIFLDISDRVSRQGNEEGLLGLAFHPEFESAEIFYVHYSSRSRAKDERSVAPNIVSQFEVSLDDPRLADPESETILLEQEQPYRNHNGGMIAFGPEGYLYVSLGDGGAANDPHGHGQNLKTLLGSILRIDVEMESDGLSYSIPSDNPFVDNSEARDELWAVGLRNVWRFSFDRLSGQLFAADVGQDSVEEVSLLESGGNYGWNRFEADQLFREDTALSVDRHRGPIASYPREMGISITGGYVYRGKAYPELQGVYFYADYVTGNIWGLKQSADGTYQSEWLFRSGRSISSFGEDDEGELYVLSFDGGIYRLAPGPKPEPILAHWPRSLSEAGVYASTSEKVLGDDLISYEVNAPFWSDGADKDRFLQLPNGQAMTYREEGVWEVPVGTTVVKNFTTRNFRGRDQFLETRLIKRTREGWEAATYVWNQDQRDAELLPEGKQFELYSREGIKTWHAPSTSECSSCHLESSGYVLGLRTSQLNLEREGGNQIEALAREGYLDIPEDWDLTLADRLASPHGTIGTLEDRARAYLDVNCAMCHQPKGPGNAQIDLRVATALSETGMVNVNPGQGYGAIEDAKIIAPGEPEKSVLLHRLETKGGGRMPSIGSHSVDQAGVDLIREWIRSLN